MQTYLKTKPVWIQLLLFLGMAFGIFMVFMLIGVAVLTNMTGISLIQLSNIKDWDGSDPNMIFFIRGMLLMQFLGLFFIPSLLFAYFSDPQPMKYAGLKKPHSPIYWIIGFILLIVAIPLVEYTGIFNRQLNLGGETQKWMQSMEEEAMKQIQFMLSKNTVTELLMNLIFIALFAGVGEELFFRGILQRLFIKAFKNPWAGIILTAILFSGFHFQFFGFLPRFLLGVLLGVIYWYSGSLWPAILAHFLYDALIIVIAYFNPSVIQNPDANIIDPSQLTIMALVSAILVGIFTWQLIKRSRTNYAEVYRDDVPPKQDLSF